MKLTSHIFISISAFLVFSCGMGRQNFNKQKYTNLKSKDNKVTIVENYELVEEPVSTWSSENQEQSFTSIEDDHVENESSDFIEDTDLERKDNKEFLNSFNSLVKKRLKPNHSDKKSTSITPQVMSPQSSEPDLNEESFPYFVAWIVYAVAGITSIALIYLGLIVGFQTLFLIGLAIWPLLIIFGVILLKLALKQKRKDNSRIMKLVVIGTAVELILASVGVLLVLLLFLLLLIFGLW